MAGKYEMVTEVVATDGEDIPAPSFTVFTVNLDSPKNVEFYIQQARDCIFKEDSMDCIESIGYSSQELLVDQERVWKRDFFQYSGWYYFKNSNENMRDMVKKDYHNGVSLGVDSTNIQIFMHDKNEYMITDTDIKMIELGSQSKNVFISIHKVVKVNNCEASETYSFNQCVENYIAKVTKNPLNQKLNRIRQC